MTSTTSEDTTLARENRWRTLVFRYPLIAFFGLAYGISWLVWMPYILSLDGFGVLPFRYPDLIEGNQLTAILPGAYLGPLAAAFTVTVVTEGRAGLRRWRRRLFQVRVGLRWYALALFAVPIAVVAGTLAMPGADLRIPSMMAVAVYLPMLVLQFFTTGLAEEPGWRDFALTRLQERHHPMVATSILGVLWMIWHLPLFLTPWGGPDAGFEVIARFALMTLAISFVMTLVFNRTRQSVPLIMVLHSNVNNFMSVLWPELFGGDQPGLLWGPAFGLCALAVMAIAISRGRLGYTRVAPSSGA